MTIGVDIRVLGDPEHSGVHEYAENLLAHLVPLDPSIRYKLFYSSFSHELPDYPWLHAPNVHVFRFHISNAVLFGASKIAGRPRLDALVRGADAFFFPHFLHAALSLGCKRITTFHDLSYVRFPEFFPWRPQYWHHLISPRWQALFSDRIIAVSDSTKNDLISLYGIDSARVARIYSGVSEAMRWPTAGELERFRVSRGLPVRFVLFLGTLEPRKNVVGLIRAFMLLKEKRGFDDLHLVIAGRRGWLCDDVFREAQKSRFGRQIIFTGYLPSEERALYYSLASVFAYPSFFEGFGFPPLEAMACGTPVVVSHTSSLPEVVGNAGLLVDPYSVASIAHALEAVLTDKRLRKKLMEQGLERVKQFSWQKSAQETLAAIRSAIS